MVEKYHAGDPLSDLISDDYRMLQILSRFNLALGFGDRSVEDACRSCGVDTATFLAVVNFVKSGGKAHLSDMVADVSVGDMKEYLRRSHTYFVNFRLPAIRRKLIEAIDCSTNQIAFLILKFYDEYAAEVARHMRYEDEHVHPYVESLLEGRIPEGGRRFSDLIHQHQDNHESIEKSGAELKSIIIKYYPSDSNATLLNEVLMDIYMMEEELATHCQLEDTLFAESVARLEEEVRLRPAQRENDQDTKDEGNPNGLSEREKEVIVEIVKGYSNKEIAENMFISVNTVMTHRRNISRKLQIHSPAGLTIYAIVNGLVKLDDVKL